MATLYDEADLKDIIMQCPDEDTKYEKPEKMYDSNGNKIYAYVTLIMLGDKYIPAALVLAKSIKDLGSEADLVVLVTDDVSADGKNALRKYYDQVIDIEYVKIANWRTKKQTTREYLNLVFTKFHVFNLTQYKKILLIDADALVLKHPDHLFSLNAPAGCYLKDKDLIIKYDKDGNYILPDNKKFAWYDKMCDCCGHGKLISKSDTDDIHKNFKNPGIGGGLMLLEPKAGELDNIIASVRHGYYRFLVERRLVWPEQQFLTLRYSGKWHGINPRFFGLQGYPHWRVLYGLQYGGDKPFLESSKMDISIRLQFPDYKLWHDMYRDILNENPEFNDIRTFEESIRMNKIFSTKLGRHVGISRNYDSNDIAKIYKVNPKKIRHYNTRYYHTHGGSQYRPNFVKPLFSNVKPYHYTEPIKRLAKYHGTDSYYGKLSNKYVPFKNERLDKYDTFDDMDRDLIMLEYTKCRPSMFIITLWTLGVKYLDDILDELNSTGNVYYVKKVKLNKRGLKSLAFWMYCDFTFSERNKFIGKKLEYMNAMDEDNEVAFIFYDNINHKRLAGQASDYKKKLRRIITNKINNNDIRGNDVMHVNDFYYQTIEYAQMILNKNTLESLEIQNTDRYSNEQFEISNNMMQTLRRWVYGNLSQLDMNRLIIIGGFILYIYGIRNSQDIDGIIIPHPELNNSEKILIQKIYDALQNKTSKIHFLDIGVEGSKYWNDKWTIKNNQVFEQFGMSNSIDLTTDPRYHMYSQGIKFYLVEHELVRKIIRNRPQDHIDFIMMKHIMPKVLGDYVTFDSNGDIKYRNDIKYIDDNNIKYDKDEILKFKYLKRDISDAKHTPEFKRYFKL